MKFFRVALFMLIGIVHYYTSNAQGEKFSVKAGPVYSWIDDLETTILHKPQVLNYTLKKKACWGYSIGGAITLPIIQNGDDPVLEAQLGAAFTLQGSSLAYRDSVRDLNYEMNFMYQYVNFTPDLLWYPFGHGTGSVWSSGLHLGAGLQLGFNVAPNNITFHSDGSGRSAQFGTDLEQQQQLRNVLKGKNIFGLRGLAGYEFRYHDNSERTGISVQLTGFYGLLDAVESVPNTYDFIDNKNVAWCIRAEFGFNIGRISKWLEN